MCGLSMVGGPPPQPVHLGVPPVSPSRGGYPWLVHLGGGTPGWSIQRGVPPDSPSRGGTSGWSIQGVYPQPVHPEGRGVPLAGPSGGSSSVTTSMTTSEGGLPWAISQNTLDVAFQTPTYIFLFLGGPM